MKLPISEVFYSLQGEGITTGKPSVFLRLKGCNLICGGNGTQIDKQLHNATWRCDTIEVWLKGNEIEFDKIFSNEQINALKNNAHLIITGGEPLLHQDKLIDFINWVRLNVFNDVYIEIETNGTIMPNEFLIKNINQWNCSPKLLNSGMNIEDILFNDIIKKLNKLNTIFKFVISKINDWEEVKQNYLNLIDKNKIYLMPSGESIDELKITKPIVAEICKNNFINFTNRTHIEIWNKKVGV